MSVKREKPLGTDGEVADTGKSGAPYLTLPHDGEIMNNLINVSCPQVGSMNPTNRGYLETGSKRSIFIE